MTAARLMVYAKCSENTTVLKTAQKYTMQAKAPKSTQKQDHEILLTTVKCFGQLFKCFGRLFKVFGAQ
jgi:hypothetical protein